MGCALVPPSPSDLDRPFIFLDNDGVLTDADAHHVAYCRRYGELMAPRFSGTAAAWAEANSAAFHAMMEWYRANAARFTDARFFEALYQVELEAAFAHVGLAPPDWETEGKPLMRRLLFECPREACALLPGAGEAVERLAAEGYRLCMASNAHSLHCEGVLSGCGLRGRFVYAFGPDLVDCATKSPEFYRRACARVGVRPEAAVVVDDSGLALAMAAEAGMKTVLVGDGPGAPDGRIASLGELPELLAEIARRQTR
jgi:HAD superfamily hydrolase (TIGR01509 family)